MLAGEDDDRIPLASQPYVICGARWLENLLLRGAGARRLGPTARSGLKWKQGETGVSQQNLEEFCIRWRGREGFRAPDLRVQECLRGPLRAPEQHDSDAARRLN